MKSPLLRLAGVVLGSTLSSLAASTLTVGPPGSGAGFNDIQPAIDAAQPGDTILVLPGSYTSFTLTKPLDLLGAGSAVVQVGSQAPVVVGGIPAGSEAVLSGFELTDRPSLQVDGCQGSVTIHDVVQSSVSDLSGCTPDAGLRATNSARVIVLSSTLRGMHGVAGHGLEAVNSEVWLVDSEAHGGSGAGWASGCTTQGGSGANLIGASLYVARSVLQAGHSYTIPFTPSGATPGITASNGSYIKLVGGPGTTIQVGSHLGSFLSVAAISLFSGSHLLLQDQVTVISESGAPPFSTGFGGTSSGTVTSMIYPTLGASALQTSPGAAVSFELTANAGTSALLAFAPATGPSAFFPGIDGAIALDLASVILVATLPVGPGGTATLNLTVPPLPALSGTSAFFQALQIGAPFQDAVTNPILLSVL